MVYSRTLPQYSKNQYPTFCKKVSFDINKLETILPELKENGIHTKDRKR